jgi:hypothetical protein
MDTENLGNIKQDPITVEKSVPNRTGRVWLGIGGTKHKLRHVNVLPAEARAVAYALFSYAEQQALIEAGTH